MKDVTRKILNIRESAARRIIAKGAIISRAA
jgi:hypothetical protein